MEVIVDYQITRFKDKDSGKLYNETEVIFDDFLFDIVTINLVVTGTYYFEPGNFTTYPDACYPDNTEIEVEHLEDADGKEYSVDILSMKEYKDLIALIGEDGANREANDPY